MKARNRMNKVGIVILNFNSSSLLKLTLDSLVRAKSEVKWELYLVDNASEAEDSVLSKKYFEEIVLSNGFSGVFFASEENKGFSGGNNIAIKHFLNDASITHICLLNSDVIVSDNWLDILIVDGFDVTGPVANVAGNEQTIAVDIKPTKDETAFLTVNSFAKRRRNAYSGSRVVSSLVTFFATVFKREIIEEIGLLDERFFPGSFEDDDYCARIEKAGFKIWIRRDCYVHHWGSGSFSNLSTDSCIIISNENRQRFEEKWGVQWENRDWKLLESCFQDAFFLVEKGNPEDWTKKILINEMHDIERAFDRLTQQAIRLSSENEDLRIQMRNELPLGENLRQIIAKILRRIMRTTPKNRTEKILTKEKHNLTQAILAQTFECMRQSNSKTVCVFAPMFTEENITDGYVQRVKAIDEGILSGFYRIYIHTHDTHLAPKIEIVDDRHLTIWLDPEDKEQAKTLRRIVQRSRTAYIHSVLRIMVDTIPEKLRNRIFLDKKIKTIWDMHGAVPEEFVMHNDYYGAQMSGDAEEFLANNADTVIVVTQTMKKHLKYKYGEALRTHVVVMPIFTENMLQPVDCIQDKALKEGQPPLVVYAGGLQKWQKIDEMQDLVTKLGDTYRYVFFVPRPDEFVEKFEESNLPAEIRVEHKQPGEVLEEYKACHYGLVLRDDIVVNNVACPTKLIEYIKFGIIPILDTPNIGDFVEFGMQYISREVFEKGAFMDEAERQRIAEKNLAVLEKLAKEYVSGRQYMIESL